MRKLGVLGLLLAIGVSAMAQEQPAVTRKIATSVAPTYPELARRMHITGTVRIEATVSPEGKPKSTRALGGSPLLVQAAIDAIQRWRWAPQSAESTELIELNFHQ